MLDQGKTITSPEVDLGGLESIVVKMRTYGGTSYDKLAIAAGSKNITTIEATKGKTMSEYTWSNTGSLSGKSALTFSCSNAESEKGIGVSSIVINATGSSVTYSRYITSCSTTTEVVNIAIDTPARKVLIGGELYIFVGEQLYTIQGQRVK